MTKLGQVAHGLPPRSFEQQVMAEINDLKRQVREARAQASRGVALGLSAALSPAYLNAHQDSITFSTSTFVDYPLGTITPPDGFGGLLFWITGWAGGTFSAPSSLSVRVYAADLATGLTNYGDPVASGTSGGALSGGASLASIGVNESPSHPITFGVSVEAVGTQDAASGNVHVSALALFTRN